MNWQNRPSPNPASHTHSDVVSGRGVALIGNYVNMFGAMGAEVERQNTGRVRVTLLVNAVDPGIVINPRAAKDTIARGVIFALSRTLHEELRFDRKRVLSRDWVTYPVLRFVAAPEQEVVLLSTAAPWGGGLGEGTRSWSQLQSATRSTTPPGFASGAFRSRQRGYGHRLEPPASPDRVSRVAGSPYRGSPQPPRA